MKTRNRSQQILNGLKRGLTWFTLFILTLASDLRTDVGLERRETTCCRYQQ